MTYEKQLLHSLNLFCTTVIIIYYRKYDSRNIFEEVSVIFEIYTYQFRQGEDYMEVLNW